MKNIWRLLTRSCLILALGVIARTAVPVEAQTGCSELIHNGGFETDTAWQLGITQLTPEYVTYAQHSGDRSLAMGITKGGNRTGYSSSRQTVTIPSAMNRVTLTFWFYAMIEGNAGSDQMELVLLGPDGLSLAKPWQSSNDSRTWNKLTFDISRWRGQTIQVYFDVYNNGTGGMAGMFLDDVSLMACPATTPLPTTQPTNTATPPPPTGTATSTPIPSTPSATPTTTSTATGSATTIPPTPTATRSPTSGPTPVACVDLLSNGGFEEGLSWWQPGTVALPVRGATSPVHGGTYSLRLGTQEDNLNSYSSVRQVLTLPPVSQRVTLQFWAYALAESATGGDRQEALIFAADGSRLATLWRVLTNDPVWRRYDFDLFGYGGQTISVYFNVYNDGAGGKTAMFLDDVRLLACDAYAPTVLPGSGPVETIPWPVELLDPSPDTTTGAVFAGVAGAPTPQLTRVALPLTPAPTITIRPTQAQPTVSETAISALDRSPLPVSSQVVATWQSRWWVVLVPIGFVLALWLGSVVGRGRRH